MSRKFRFGNFCLSESTLPAVPQHAKLANKHVEVASELCQLPQRTGFWENSVPGSGKFLLPASSVAVPFKN